MNGTVILDCGCLKCGAAESTVTVEFAPAVVINDDPRGVSIGPSLDIVLTCEGCGVVTNGFMGLADMVEV